MSLLCVGLLFVLSIGVHAEQCKYEFIVPEGNCRQNPTLNSEDEQIPVSIMHMQSNLQMVNARFNSMVAGFKNEMTTLDADSKHVKEVTKELQSQLDAVQGKLTEFKGLKDDVRTLKESLTAATGSLGPQLSRLKDKMIDFAAKFQSQSTAQSSIYSSIQRQLAETASSIGKQSQDIEKMKHSAETVQELVKQVAAISQERPGSSDIKSRIDSIEDKLKDSTDNDVINRLKSAVNMLQSELLASARQSRGKIINLEGIVNSLRSEMEVLKRSVQK